MKKILFVLSTLLMIALLALFLTLFVSADTGKNGTWENLSWSFNETTGELTISGEGRMKSLEKNVDPYD